MTPELSIIIPIYNAAAYLEKCISSLLSQTFSDFEIICINDCSPDDSEKIIKEFSMHDKRIRLIAHEHNMGAASARNTGLDNAEGEYIYFMDADDWLDSDYLDRMVEIIKCKNVNIAVNSNVIIEKSNSSLRYNHPGQAKLPSDSYINAIENIQNIFWVVWNKIYRADFINGHRFRFPPNCQIAEDMVFQFMLFPYAEQIYYFEGPSYHYQQWDGSVSKNKDWGIAHITSFRRIYEFYKANNLLDKDIKIYSTMPFFNISDSSTYEIYKSFFQLITDYMNCKHELFNDLDFHFANNLLGTSSYEDYISRYPSNAVISFTRRNLKR